MSLRSMYSSTVEIWENKMTVVNGSMRTSWQKIAEMADPKHGVPGEMRCRADLGFMRPGKDAPSPITAGRAPDRVGVLAFDPTPYVKAGHRIKFIAGPHTGIFELKAIPDPATDFSSVHHLEVQIIEVAQAAVDFPGGTS